MTFTTLTLLQQIHKKVVRYVLQRGHKHKQAGSLGVIREGGSRKLELLAVNAGMLYSVYIYIYMPSQHKQLQQTF